MAQATDDLSSLALEPERLYAAAFVLVALTALYIGVHGPAVSDWEGYQFLFDQDGGWLRRQGRDPLFLYVLQGGRAIFGGNGYDLFRGAVFAAFAAAAARFAYAMAPGRTWAIFLALVAVAAFMIKALAQIREGMAFLIVTWPLVATYRHGENNPLAVGVFACVAPLMHSGAALFAGLWAMAAALSIIPRLVTWRGLPWLLLGAGLLAGASAAAWISASASTLEFSLRDLGIDTDAETIGGVAKDIYWLANGVAVLILWRELLRAAHGAGRFGGAFAIGLGSLVLPAVYTVCLVLVFRQFYLPAVTSMAIRLLISSMQLALLILGLRGRVNLASIGIASALILDQARLLFVDSPI